MMEDAVAASNHHRPLSGEEADLMHPREKRANREPAIYNKETALMD